MNGWAVVFFPSGVAEVVVRALVIAILTACLAVSIVILQDNDAAVTQDSNMYWEVVFLPFVSLWTIIVTVIALLVELATIVLRFLLTGLATECFSQYYIIYGIVDIIRYFVLALCFLPSVAVFNDSRNDAFDDGDSCDVLYPGDPACDELRDIGDRILAPVVLCALAIGILAATIVWEIVYLVAGCNRRFPGPKGKDEI